MSKHIKLSKAPIGSVIRITGVVIGKGSIIDIDTSDPCGILCLKPERMVEVLSSPIVVGSSVKLGSGTVGTVVWLDEALDKYLVEVGTPRYVILFNKNQIELT